MSYKSYPAYKNSGNEWLGEIPEGWDIYRLKETTKKIPFAIVDGPFGSMLKADEYQEEGVPLVRITNLSYSGDFSSEDLVYISDLKAAELSRSTVKYGDIVIGKTGATIGKFAPYPNQQPGVLASSCIKITFSDALIELAFIRYIFMSKPFQEELIETSGGSTRDTINIGPFGNLHIFLPPLSTQKAIAAFLDAKTARIDGLVRDYVELVSLLKEKRQALVSHAVTRGLSELVGPDDTEFGEWARPIAFKNSGVEWLGEIPEGWEIYQLRRDLDFVTSGSRGWAAYYSEEGALFLRIGNLSRENIALQLDDIQRVLVPTDNNEASRTKVCNSDLLVSITADIGSVAVVENIAEPAFISQHLAICRFSSTTRVLPRWAAYFLKSGSGRTQFDQKAYGGTKIQLSLDDVREMLVTVPQKEEQQAIVAFLDRKTAKLDALIAEAEGAIELLKERRSTLITTTVTGKINVEGVEAAKP